MLGGYAQCTKISRVVTNLCPHCPCADDSLTGRQLRWLVLVLTLAIVVWYLDPLGQNAVEDLDVVDDVLVARADDWLELPK